LSDLKLTKDYVPKAEANQGFYLLDCDNAVIGANAVVTSDISAFAVACGIPAKVVSQNSNHCFDKYWGKHFAHDYDLK